MIPVSKPIIGEREKISILECIESGWISSSGPIVEKFEKTFSNSVDRHYGISVANGTAALEIAISAIGIIPGDEVIMSAFTIISCAAAIVKAGATPVLVDNDPLTWNMDVNQIEAQITDRTRAILVVHTYGLPVDMNPVINIAKKYGLMIIEDAAEAHGLNYGSRPCGSFGIISTFSFFANKNVTTGEGGMIVTDDPAIADKCRELRNLCFKPNRRFMHEHLGWNYRFTSLQAALGIAQLKRLNRIVAKKREIGNRYLEAFSGLPYASLPLSETYYSQNSFWVFGILIEDPAYDATHIMKSLHDYDVETRPFFWPMHLQPVFQNMNLFMNESHPVSEKLSRYGFYIPSGPKLDLSEQKIVIDAVLKVFDEKF
jgi:perosamine synthetase